MRSLFLGLAALAACLTTSFGGAAYAQEAAAAPAAPQTPAEKGMSMAPAAITAAKIACTPTAATFLFSSEATIGETKTQADFIEVACENNLGYVLASAKDGSGVQAFDCISTSGNGADGQPHALRCTLPANANAAKTIQPVLEAHGLKCDVQNARAIGMTAAATYYEFACKDADGLFVGIENPRSDGKLQINTCYQRIGANPACTLTTQEQSLAPILALAGQAPKPCAPTDQRLVTRSAGGNAYYEFACPDKTGFIVETKPDGSFSAAIPCEMSVRIAGGCKLTAFTPAPTGPSPDDKTAYTALAKKVGFDCDVSWFGRFPKRSTDAAGTEVVELTCANQKEGGVGYFGGPTEAVVTCVQANAQGFKCSRSDPALGHGRLTAALKSKGRTTCTVSEARHVGFSPEEDFVEVGCADGAPGWVIAFATRTNTVTDVLNCGQADGIAGGCQLASNTKKR